MIKKLVISLIAALFVLGQVISPALASNQTESTCGDTYTVKSGDYLSKIARTCGVTLTSIYNANPQIKDFNKIYPGQVIRITPGAVVPTPTTPTSTPTTSTSTGTYTVVRGDTLYKIAVRYGISMQSLLNANPNVKDPSRIYVGQVLKLPGTSSTSTGTVSVTGSRISVSSTRVKPGTTIEVKVWGFPAKAGLDYRLGKQNEAYSVVMDVTTDSSGAATAKITIPSSAKSGEKWVVKVLTTDRADATDTTSPVITIYE